MTGQFRRMTQKDAAVPQTFLSDLINQLKAESIRGTQQGAGLKQQRFRKEINTDRTKGTTNVTIVHVLSCNSNYIIVT